MKIDLGDYAIETDERQFIVKSKRIVTESKLTKEENIGKEVLKTLGYFTSFKGALKFLANKIVLDNDDIKSILDKLEQLHNEIAKLSKA